MPVNWMKCHGDVWCSLSTVNLAHSHFGNMHGVYIIWHGGPNPGTVYVGQGFIKERLTEHRGGAEIQEYQGLGLYVTWASVPESSLDGVEAFLAGRLQPKVGSKHPTADPIEVNLPW